jgi:hypothetical protein
MERSAIRGNAAAAARKTQISLSLHPRSIAIIYTPLLMADESGKMDITLACLVLLPRLGTMETTHHSHRPGISLHAIERYQQRVSYVAPAEAARRLAELAVNSTRRPTPRRWTNAPPGPGVLFLYPHTDSSICLLMKGSTVVTVFSRDVCRAWRAKPEMDGARRFPRRPPYRRPAPGSFSMEGA